MGRHLSFTLPLILPDHQLPHRKFSCLPLLPKLNQPPSIPRQAFRFLHNMRISRMFSRRQTPTNFPPHRPHDCCLDLSCPRNNPHAVKYTLFPGTRTNSYGSTFATIWRRKGVIRKSTSCAGAPIFFVDKGKKSDPTQEVPEKRLVVNYQGLDKITEKFGYTLPLIEDLLDSLQSATIFTKIDLRSAYNLVRMREGDEWRRAFRSKCGLYVYLVMHALWPSQRPSLFSAFCQGHLLRHGIIKFVVIIYLDDFLIFSNDPESHTPHVRAVLQSL
jgi:hypothetical protein